MNPSNKSVRQSKVGDANRLADVVNVIMATLAQLETTEGYHVRTFARISCHIPTTGTCRPPGRLCPANR